MKSEIILACFAGGAFLGASLFGLYGAVIFAILGFYIGYKSNTKKI